jgi:hypothetical protein
MDPPPCPHGAAELPAFTQGVNDGDDYDVEDFQMPSGNHEGEEANGDDTQRVEVEIDTQGTESFDDSQMRQEFPQVFAKPALPAQRTGMKVFSSKFDDDEDILPTTFQYAKNMLTGPILNMPKQCGVPARNEQTSVNEVASDAIQQGK